jgi:hypothetical protein
MLDPRYKNMTREYACENCQTNLNAPMHCGNAMHLEDLNNGRYWVCWMGATSCGNKATSKQEYTPCCDGPSIPVYETINP